MSDSAKRAEALRRWADRNGYGALSEGEHGERKAARAAGADRFDSDVAAPSESASEPLPEEDLKNSDDVREHKNVLTGERCTCRDEPHEIAKAPKRGKNNDGETMRDVVLAMTESELRHFAERMASLKRHYGTRNLAATLLRAVDNAEAIEVSADEATK